MGFLLQMLVACTCVIAPILGLTIWILLKSSPRCKGTNDPSNDAETHVSPRAANARLIIISLLITTIAKTTYSYVLICEPAPEGVLCSRAHPTLFLSLSLSTLSPGWVCLTFPLWQWKLNHVAKMKWH